MALLTGENGTGKSVVIDAIRAVFGEEYAMIERDLSRPGQDPKIVVHFEQGTQMVQRSAKEGRGPG